MVGSYLEDDAGVDREAGQDRFRFGLHQFFEQRVPDSWILMGGLAIATLAGDHIHRVARVLDASDWIVAGVRTGAVVTWLAASM